MLGKYVANLRKLYSDSIFENRYFVLNNTSCDLDSVCSSILCAFGYFFNSRSSKSEKEYFFPVMNCLIDEFPTRLDVIMLLESEGINYKDLLFLEEIKFNETQDKVILVDHNVLDPTQLGLAPLVHELIDHHEDKQFSFPNLKEKNIQTPLASATTLVLNRFYANPEIVKSFTSSNFLISSLLMDSNNFSKGLYKSRWDDLDMEVCKSISSVIPYNKQLFSDIANIKGDKEANLNLGVKGIMIKDKKRFSYLDNKLNIEWSSLHVKMKAILKKYGISEVLSYYKSRENNDFAFCHCKQKGKLLLYIYDYNNQKVELSKFLVKFKIYLGKDFIKKEQLTDNFILVSMVNNYSRKTLEPIIQKTLEIYNSLI